MSLRTRTWEILSVAKTGDKLSVRVDVAILTLILLNVVAVVLESVHSIREAWGPFFMGFELFSLAAFSVEYLLRVWSCVTLERFAHPLWGRLRYMVTPMALIDFMAIFPTMLAIGNSDFRSLRGFRLARIFMLAKTGRYHSSIRVFGKVFNDRKEELLITTCLMLVLLVISAALMHGAENGAQPEAFSSIPATMWWAVATLTTVGYGDVAPITPIGKVLGAVVAIVGIGFFALPAGILGSGFVEEFQHHKNAISRCPKCNGLLNEHDTDP